MRRTKLTNVRLTTAAEIACSGGDRDCHTHLYEHSTAQKQSLSYSQKVLFLPGRLLSVPVCGRGLRGRRLCVKSQRVTRRLDVIKQFVAGRKRLSTFVT